MLNFGGFFFRFLTKCWEKKSKINLIVWYSHTCRLLQRMKWCNSFMLFLYDLTCVPHLLIPSKVERGTPFIVCNHMFIALLRHFICACLCVIPTAQTVFVNCKFELEIDFQQVNVYFIVCIHVSGLVILCLHVCIQLGDIHELVILCFQQWFIILIHI